MRLSVNGARGIEQVGGSHFYERIFYEGAVGESPSDVQQIRIRNRGGGSLEWSATASEPWIKLSANTGGPLRWFNNRNTVEVTVDVTGLEAGYHEGEVLVDSIGAPARNGAQTIPVRL